MTNDDHKTTGFLARWGRWPRSARLSFITGLLGLGCTFLVFFVLWASIEASAFIGFTFSAGGELVIAALGITAVGTLPVSVVSGLMALRHTRAVLWWLVPIVLLMLVLGSSIASSLSF